MCEMTEKEKLQEELLTRFRVVGDELAFNLADYFSDPECREALELMCADGALVMIDVKVGKAGDIPEGETMGDRFEAMKADYIDLILPVDIGKRLFTGVV